MSEFDLVAVKRVVKLSHTSLGVRLTRELQDAGIDEDSYVQVYIRKVADPMERTP